MNSTVSTFSTADSFLAAVANVDILIDETFIANNLSDVYKNYGITPTNAPTLKFAANKRIYREDDMQTRAGGLDWFESAIVQEDAVLADVINVVNPSYPFGSYKRTWFRNVALGENFVVSNAGDCKTGRAPGGYCACV